jgi:hypothetical protein
MSNTPQRGDCIMFPFTVVDGPNEEGQYDLIFFDEGRGKPRRLTTSFPSDIEIIDHVKVSDEISGK